MTKRNPDLSYSNLMYIFPAAAWVSQSIELFKGEISGFKIYLALIFFSFIPAEIYATNLWDKNRKGSQEFWTTVSNVIGVFFLTVLYLGYPILNELYVETKSIKEGRILFIGLGMLLVLNFAWNALERPNDDDAFLRLQKHINKLKEKTEKWIGKFYYKTISFTIPLFGTLNFIFFALITTSVGFLLIYIAVPFDFKIFNIEDYITSHSFSLFFIGFLTLLTVWKIFHGYMFFILDSINTEGATRESSVLLDFNDESFNMIATGKQAIFKIQKFRWKCMTNDLRQLKMKNVDHDKIKKTTPKYDKSKIAYDEWDDTGIHIVLRSSLEIIGSIRLNCSKNGKLPFLKYLKNESIPDICIGENDFEISKLFVLRDYRKTFVTSALLFSASKLVRLMDVDNVGNVYADVPLSRDKNKTSGKATYINTHSYQNAGFEDTGIVYYDPRYSAKSVIYKLSNEKNLFKYQDLSERNYRKSQKIFSANMN